jgi:predicted metal-binding integral membrane protein DUF2182
MSAIAATSAASRPSLRRLVWLHPEWWTLALCAVAWSAMFRPHMHHLHSHHLVSIQLTKWMVMTVAMMLPLVVGPIRFAAKRSLWRRRHRAIAGFLLSYLGCWLLVGVPVAFINPGPLLAAAAFVASAAWNLMRYRRLALATCHWTMPLAPYGWRADRDCVLYGWRIGTSCALSCYPLMLACALSSHALPVMIFGMAVGIIERYTYRPDQRLLSGALLAAAVISFLR